MIELKTYKMVDEKYCTDCACVIPSEVYIKKDADAAIAELKQTIDKLTEAKKSAELILMSLLDCGLIKEWYFNGKFNAILKADDPHLKIAELKQKLENVQASMYADVVDANMEIRRLNYKYWSDKADEAAKMKRLIYAGEIIYLDEYCNEKDWRIMHKVWEDEETKCRAKAEKFK